MQEVQKVINKDERVVTDDGSVVTEHTHSAKTDVDAKITIANIIWYIYGLIAIILLMRFILKITAANAGNSFVNLIYSISGIFSTPFDTIFGITKASSGTTTSVFEPSVFVALGVYALVAWGLSRLLTLNEPPV